MSTNIIIAPSGSAKKSGIHTQVPFWGIWNFQTSANLAGTTTTSMGLTSDQMIFYPYIPNVDFKCGNFAIEVTSPGASSSLGRICVYDSNVDGLPGTLLYSSTDLNLNTTGLKTIAASFDFIAGTTYWLTFQTNGSTAPQVKAINTNGLVQIWNYQAAGGAVATSWIQVGIVFSSGAPNPASVNSFSFQSVPLITMTKL